MNVDELPTGKIVVCLKLAGCTEVTTGFDLNSPDAWYAYLDFGRVSGAFCGPLMERAAEVPDANLQVRELARNLLKTLIASKMPNDQKYFGACGIGALFFWLAIHDCQHGKTLSEAMLTALQTYQVATFTIGCSERGAYVITVGNVVADLTADLQFVDQATVSSHSHSVH